MNVRYFFTTLFLVACTKLCAGQRSSPPFEVIEVYHDTRDHRSLSCEMTGNFRVSEAIFFRNGVRENTSDDACIPASQEGKLHVNDTPECDGYYFCGIRHSETGRHILSGPRKVVGKFSSRPFL